MTKGYSKSKELKEQAALSKKKEKERAELLASASCDECCHKTWNRAQENLDIYGQPITMRCPFYENGMIGIIRGQHNICENYKKE